MYDPTSRVLTVLELLQAHPGISGPELARRMEVDVRSVRRYITKLQDAGIPVETIPGRRGGYRLRPGYTLPPLIFTTDEAKAIVLGLIGGLPAGGGANHAHATIETALSKLMRVMPQESREQLRSIPAHVHFAGSNRAVPAIAYFLDLVDAVDSKRRVELAYLSRKGEATTRVVEPYGLVQRDRRWYLVAYCTLRAEYRAFRVDRIQDLRLLNERFRPDPAFDFRSFADQRLAKPAGRWRLVVEFLAPPTTVIPRIPAGLGDVTETSRGTRLECGADDLDETARYLVMVGLPFVVVEPPEMRLVLRRLAEEIARAAGEVDLMENAADATGRVAGVTARAADVTESVHEVVHEESGRGG